MILLQESKKSPDFPFFPPHAIKISRFMVYCSRLVGRDYWHLYYNGTLVDDRVD